MVRLISVEEVIARAATTNMDKALISEALIETAQDRHIRPWMEYKLFEFDDSMYRKLLTDFKGGNLSTEDKKVLDDFIKPALAHYIVYDGIVSFAFNLTSAGLIVNTIEDTRPAGERERAQFAKVYKQRADSYAEQFTRFIEENSNESDYPLYRRGNNVRNFIKRLGGTIVSKTRHIRIDDEIPD